MQIGRPAREMNNTHRVTDLIYYLLLTYYNTIKIDAQMIKITYNRIFNGHKI